MAEKVMLIDGNSIINRAFYALPILTSKGGEYTNAVLGFLNIFFKLYEDEQPDYVAVAFDLPAPTFRHIKFAEYKGTRKSMPEELRPQIPLLKELLKSMNIKTVEMEGYEADDILGTLAVRAQEQGFEAVIVSGDRDMLQVSTDKIKIRIPKTRGGKTEVEDYYAADVLEKMGVTPTEFIDVKALMGDTSDNIPGVAGIGEKTAYSIIKEYKNIETAIENADSIKPKKAAENLVMFKEQAILSKELATIEVNAPIAADFSLFRADDIFNENALDMFKRLDLKSYYNRFEIKENKPNVTELQCKFIDSEKEAAKYFEQLAAESLVAYKLIYSADGLQGASFCARQGTAAFIELSNSFSEMQLFWLSKAFFEGAAKKIALDAKRDMHVFHKYGIHLKNLCFDVMIGAYILDASKEHYEFNDIAEDFLNERYDASESPCRQADVIFRSFPLMEQKIKANGQTELYYEIELPLITVLEDMELSGIKINEKELIAFGEKLQKQLDILTAQIYELAGEEFNINSPKQMSVILFEKLGLKGGKKTKTGWSTSADILEKLANKHEIVNLILEYRTNAKLKSTYADGLLSVMDKKTHKIHSTFNQAVTTTGRISSTEPNLQNIPIRTELGREIRRVFIPTDDNYVFVDADYSQIELRILAHMAQDETFINAFKEGQDIHKITASQVFNVPFDEVTPQQRSYAKAVNFGIVYGIGAFSLSEDIHVSVKEAGAYIEAYFSKYNKVKQYLDGTIAQAKKDGYSSTIFNRRRNIPEINSGNFNIRSFGERVAMNMPVQGSAADIIKIAMVKVYNRFSNEGLRSKLILQVHDELLIEAHVDEVETVKSILIDEMENAVKLSVPLDIDVNIGKNWLEAK